MGSCAIMGLVRCRVDDMSELADSMIAHKSCLLSGARCTTNKDYEPTIPFKYSSDFVRMTYLFLTTSIDVCCA